MADASDGAADPGGVLDDGQQPASETSKDSEGLNAGAEISASAFPATRANELDQVSASQGASASDVRRRKAAGSMRGDTVLLSDTELRFIDDAEKQAEAEFDSDDDDDDGDGDDDAEDSITLDTGSRRRVDPRSVTDRTFHVLYSCAHACICVLSGAGALRAP